MDIHIDENAVGDADHVARNGFRLPFGKAAKARKGADGMASRKKGTDSAQDASNRIKDPDDWTTGDEPMTGAQESYLNTLATEAGETVDPDLTKAEASKRIDELQDKTGRG
jgi:Protein of unknown function (DUF3072)